MKHGKNDGTRYEFIVCQYDKCYSVCNTSFN